MKHARAQRTVIGARRKRLAGELRARGAPVCMHAPAGYGKSTFANLLRELGFAGPLYEARFNECARSHGDCAVVGPDTLAFDDEELAEIFRDLQVSPHQLARIRDLARGWPIAALYLRRLAELGVLDRTLGHFADPAYDDLFEYVHLHVLSCEDGGALRDHPLVRAALGEPHAHATQAAPARARVRIELFRGQAFLDGRKIALSAREAAVLFTLAAHAEHAVEPRRLAKTIWPDLDEHQAQAALKIAIHRLRTRLGGAGAIVFSRGRYELAAAVPVDATQLERALEERSPDDEALRAFLPVIGYARPPRLRDAEWFAPIEAALSGLAHRLAERFAHRAFEREDAAAALQIGRSLLAADPCDEEGCAYVVHALLSEGDLEGARREYDAFSERLRTELGCEPSFAFDSGAKWFR